MSLSSGIEALRREPRGFTLIEMIAVLVLLGIVALAGGVVLVNGMESYFVSTRNTRVGMQAQVAMERIAMEFREVTEVLSFTPNTSITYRLEQSCHPWFGGKTRTLFLSGESLQMGNADPEYAVPLLDGVEGFTLQVAQEDIDNDGAADDTHSIRITVALGGGRDFAMAVYPRALVQTP
jgi:prepilin-type N-terminal cleavage/methylation domain-containing protein